MSTWNQPQHVVARFSLQNGKVQTMYISTRYGFRQQNPHGTILIRYALINGNWSRTELNDDEICALTGASDTYAALKRLSETYEVCGSDMFSPKMFGVDGRRWDGKRWISGGPILNLSLPGGEAMRDDINRHHPYINKTIEGGRWVIKNKF